MPKEKTVKTKEEKVEKVEEKRVLAPPSPYDLDMKAAKKELKDAE